MKGRKNMRINRLLPLFTAVFMLLCADIYAEPTGKQGIWDQWPEERYERKAVGINGHYYVDGVRLDDLYHQGWVEDEEGNDIFRSGELYLLSEKFEIYEDGFSFVNGDFKTFGGYDFFHSEKIRFCIEFPDFAIPAVTNIDINKALDPTDTENTIYYTADGERIEDVYKYISEYGEQPQNGVYYDKVINENRNFLPKEPIVGCLDAYCGKNLAVPRIRVGKTDRWLCGSDVEETGIGSWIETSDGKDLFNQGTHLATGIYKQIAVNDPVNEVYMVSYVAGGDPINEGYVVSYNGEGWGLIDKNFERIKLNGNTVDVYNGNYYAPQNVAKRKKNRVEVILCCIILAVGVVCITAFNAKKIKKQ